jgi:hypothetical protein
MISPAPRRRTDALKPEQWKAATEKIVSEIFAEYCQNIIYSTIFDVKTSKHTNKTTTEKSTSRSE